MKHLSYRENELYIDSVKVMDIADEMFTPFYVYAKSAILGRIAEFKEVFEPLDPIISYAPKALDNINILRVMLNEGLYLSAISYGEFHKALIAGFPQKQIIFGGPGKSDEEITKALYEKPLFIQTGSIFELEALKDATETKKVVQDIGLRLNLGIDPKVHPYWSEGGKESKFGLSADMFERALTIISNAPGLKLKSIGAHLGSQVTKIDPFVDQANKLVDLFLQAKAGGHNIEFINMGGGYSIDYEEGESIALDELAAKLIPVLKEADGKVIFEPGRFLVADSGLLITQVLGVKQAGEITFVIVDAGTNDLPGPALFESYHEAVPVVIHEGDEITADIVGPVSGSGDYLGLSRPMVRPRRGEFLAFLNAGAYCSTMASNFNSRRRAAEVLVEEEDFTVIRHRESWDDLNKSDVLDLGN